MMYRHGLLVCLGVVVTLAALAEGAPDLSTYPHFSQLHSNFDLHWKVDTANNNITFVAIVKTTGWVGLGVSPDGSMPNSDVAIGWVDSNGKGHISDRIASNGRTTPIADTKQDLVLISASEANGVTTLEWSRPLDSCDTQDLKITADTTRVVWAYGSSDPDPEPGFHSTFGTRSVDFLSGAARKVTWPSDSTYVDAKMTNYAVPSADTTYACKVVKLPTDKEYHLIGFEPIYTTGTKQNFHHAVLYQCGDISAEHANFAGDCGGNMPVNLKECRGGAIIGAWAVGGLETVFPPEAGYPLGGGSKPGTAKTLLLEIHYDNPTKLSNIVDSSGLRLHYTAKLRKYDAGMLSIGAPVNPGSPLIPPRTLRHTETFQCNTACLSSGYLDQEATVFGTMLHAHTTGVALRLSHMRDGKALPDIDRNDHYDFNYQAYRDPPPNTVIKQGDTLSLKCDFDTSKRTSWTVGGEGTLQEMCIAFVYVFPAPAMHQCWSAKDLNSVVQEWAAFLVNEKKIDVGKFAEADQAVKDLGTKDASDQFATYLNTLGLDFTDDVVRSSYYDAYAKAPAYSLCNTYAQPNGPVQTFKPKEVGAPCIADVCTGKTCDAGGSASTTHRSVTLWTTLAALVAVYLWL